ncbi:hypothetical protein ACHAXT_004766 [Thalassiosira profunda]
MDADSQPCRRSRSPGRARRRRRSSVSVDAASTSKRPARRSSVEFDVEIPDCYSALSHDVGHRQQRDIDGGDRKTGPAGEENIGSGGSDGDETSSRKQAAAHHKEGASEDTPESKRQHFIASLEKHGYSAGAWDAMASELKWTAEDVKVHAYSYFQELVRGRTKDTMPVENEGQRDEGATSWSFHELILLDSLMLKYCNDLSAAERSSKVAKDISSDSNRSTVWEKIAAKLPGKTASCVGKWA